MEEIKRKCKIEDSFAMYYKNTEFLEWWADKRSPFEIKYNSTKTIKFKCPYCGYTIEKIPKFISKSSFKHLCNYQHEIIKNTNIRNNDLREKMKVEKEKQIAQKKLDDKYGKGTWTIILFTKRSGKVILKHTCGEEKVVSRFINAINNNLTCKCEL